MIPGDPPVGLSSLGKATLLTLAAVEIAVFGTGFALGWLMAR